MQCTVSLYVGLVELYEIGDDNAKAKGQETFDSFEFCVILSDFVKMDKQMEENSFSNGQNYVRSQVRYVRRGVLRGGSAVGRFTCDWQVAGSIPAGPLSRYIGQLSLASLTVAKSRICFGWG